MTFTRLAARAVHVVQLISTTDSRATERLCVLLTASSVTVLPICMHLIQPSLMSAGFLRKETLPSNSSHTETSAQQKKYDDVFEICDRMPYFFH